MTENEFIDKLTSPKKKLSLIVSIIIINLFFFCSIGITYRQYFRSNHNALFNENILNIRNLNIASGNSAFVYTENMSNKINDTVNYIEHNNLSYYDVVNVLQNSNTNLDRQFHLILSGTYSSLNKISFGDYSGISIKMINKPTSKNVSHLHPITTKINYGYGYYDIYRAFTDVADTADDGLCFIPEFTNPENKEKSFAVYRHLKLHKDDQIQLYTLLLVVKSETALSSFNSHIKYESQSSVLTTKDGTYLVKSNEFRNTNFFDYICNYNSLSLEQRKKIQDDVLNLSDTQNTDTDLFYKNHQGKKCFFALHRLPNNWYSITCIPIGSMYSYKTQTNFSLMILLLFVLLFCIDGLVILYVLKMLNMNIRLAKQATEQANTANKAKSRILSTMSHELRTPLNAIIGFATLSIDTLDNPQQLKDYLRKIEISSKLLLQLISDILDISAIETSKLQINYSQFNIAKLITTLSAIYYDQCQKKDIEFNVILKNIHSEMLIGDSVRVNQILLNFLSNAVKYTAKNGQITLFVDAKKRDDHYLYIKFSVIDTGCGIDDELLPRLFKPFERANNDNQTNFSGTGLGLSIAKNITELMNGTIGVKSQVNKGSTFWAEIPFTTPPEEILNPIVGLKILALVSNYDENIYLKDILTNFKIEHHVSLQKNEFIDKFSNEQHYNLCIIDWNSNKYDTISLIKQIRLLYSSEQMKIIVFSYDLYLTKKLCLDVGANLLFCKPIFSSSLYNVLQEITSINNHFIFHSDPAPTFKNKRILLVEDNELNREVSTLLLQSFGLNIELAENGEIAYKKFLDSDFNYYDLIFMDIQMPVMNGYNSTIAIRACEHPQAKDIPIIAMTADAFYEDVQKAIQAGMNEHISKPIDRNILFSILKRYLHDN